MQDFLTQLVQQGYIVPLGLTAIGALIAIVSVLAAYWHKVRVAEMDAALKHKMLEQGMSADDIKKVMEASTGSGSTPSSGGASQTK
jgi:hypothetical protein